MVEVFGSFKIDFTSGVDVTFTLGFILPPLNTFLNIMDLMGVAFTEITLRSLGLF